LVVTGLENEENMDEWWGQTRGTFSKPVTTRTIGTSFLQMISWNTSSFRAVAFLILGPRHAEHQEVDPTIQASDEL